MLKTSSNVREFRDKRREVAGPELESVFPGETEKLRGEGVH